MAEPAPPLPDEEGNAYVFEKTVRFANPDGTESGAGARTRPMRSF